MYYKVIAVSRNMSLKAPCLIDRPPSLATLSSSSNGKPALSVHTHVWPPPIRLGPCTPSRALSLSTQRRYQQRVYLPERDGRPGFFREVNKTTVKSCATTSSAFSALLKTKSSYLLSSPSFFRNRRVGMLCISCGRVVDIDLFDVDHVQSSRSILKRQQALIDRMNADSAFAEKIRQESTNKGYFIQELSSSGTRIRGNKYYYSMYHNDLENLMLICKKCNGATGKHMMNFIQYFADNDFYGSAFVLSLGTLNTSSIIITSESGQGLGAAARAWFHSHHYHYFGKRALQGARAMYHLHRQNRYLSTLEYGGAIQESRENDGDHSRQRHIKKRRRLLDSTLTVGLALASSVLAPIDENSPRLSRSSSRSFKSSQSSVDSSQSSVDFEQDSRKLVDRVRSLLLQQRQERKCQKESIILRWEKMIDAIINGHGKRSLDE